MSTDTVATETHAEGVARRAAERRAQQVTTLRALADVIEANEGPTAGYIEEGMNAWYLADKDQAAELMRLALAKGWAVTKHYDGENDPNRPTGRLTKLTVQVPGGLALDGLVGGEVCKAVVVGTEEVEVVDYSATLPTKTVTRDVVRWECEPLLASVPS